MQLKLDFYSSLSHRGESDLSRGVRSPPRPAMSEDTKSLHAAHNLDAKPEDPKEAAAPVELTAMVVPQLIYIILTRAGREFTERTRTP